MVRLAAIEQVEQLSSLLCQWIAEYAANIVRDTRGRAFPHLRLVTEEQEVLGPQIDVGDERNAMHEWLWTEQEATSQFEKHAEAERVVPA